ncbi:MAG TPA: class I SAM-dependent methyltransferase, partial [Armatimonadota bacterium]|nr:class I SAM-dependent methyltransferase [Armatimonadota bacterium]
SVADKYDIMVDWGVRLERERPFFAHLFADAQAKRVLDVGCGTGHHARLFAAMAPLVVGIDPSAAMLARAQTLTDGDNPRFIEGGFSDIPALPGAFDVITVLGNTLAHAHNARGLARALKAMRLALAPGGRLVIQAINYDSLLVARSRWLPVVARRAEGKEYLFLREHRIAGRHAEFTIITAVRDDQGWHQQVERNSHVPLTSELLQAALDAAGFRAAQFFGDFHGAEYDPASSGSMVVVAR